MRPPAIAAGLVLILAAACSRVTTPPYGGEKESGLVAATVAGDVVKVRQLLSAGADPNKMVEHEGNDQSAWFLALQQLRPHRPEQVEIVEAFLKAGADPENAWGTGFRGGGFWAPRRPGTGADAPLDIAMLHPDAQVVRAILAVKPDARGGQRALVMAIETRATEIAHLLVEAGVDVNCHPGANTPLLAAIEARDEAMMTYLEQHGAREKP